MAARKKEKIGFVGVGNMGAPMIRNLVETGWPVVAFDLRPEALAAVAAENALVTAAGTLAETGAACKTVITMLPTGKDVRAAVLDKGGLAEGLAKDGVVADMSSSEPEGTRALAKELEARGLHLVDAPVSGGVPRAVSGTLTIMAGGPESVVARVEPALSAMGKVYRTGSVGTGHAMKALNNYLSAASLAATSEAIIIGRKFGLDGAVMADILNVSTGRSNTTEMKLHQHILNRKFGAGFTLKLLDKDVAMARALAKSLGVPARNLDLVSGLLHEALEALGEGADHTELFRYLEGPGKGDA